MGFVNFKLTCNKCGSEDVDINYIGSAFELVCKDCDNWEANE